MLGSSLRLSTGVPRLSCRFPGLRGDSTLHLLIITLLSFDLWRNYCIKHVALFEGELDYATPRVFGVLWVVVLEG